MHTRAKGNQGLLPYIPEINRATRRRHTQAENMATTSGNRGSQARPTQTPPPIPNNPPGIQIPLEPTIEEEANVENVAQPEQIRVEEYYEMPNEQRRSIADYMTPEFSMHNSIYVPPLENVNFHVHPSVLTLVQNSPFSGLPSEDPHVHITRFVRACGMFKQQGVSDEIIRLKLFPFSVVGEASRWLDSQDDHHFRSWPQLHKEFMNEFFPLTKTMKIRKQVQEFKQSALESLGEAWRRFKLLKRQCPHDLMHPWDVISSFYGGLTDEGKMLLDSSSRGAFLSLAPPEAEGLIETISSNTSFWYDKRDTQAGMYEVKGNVANEAKIEAMNHEIKRLQSMVEKLEVKAKPCMALALYCNICGGPHDTNACTSPSASEHVEAVDYQRGANYNAYGGGAQNQNHGWKQGDGWQHNGGFQGRPSYNQGGKPTYGQGEKGRLAYGPPQGNGAQMTHYRPNFSSQVDHLPQRRDDIRELDERLSRTIMEIKNDRANLKQEITQEIRQEIAGLRQESKATLKTIENQISQMFKMMSDRHYGQLPSNTENNPKERVSAVAAIIEDSHIGCDPMEIVCGLCECEKKRKGKEVEKTTSCSQNLDEVKVNDSCEVQPKEEGSKATSCSLEGDLKGKHEEITSCDLGSKGKENVLPKHESNAPKRKDKARKGTFNAFIQKFLCDAQWRELFENDGVEDFACLGKETSALVTTGCPIKKGDPGAFVVPCSIKDMGFTNALADLGASINLMPLSVYEGLKLSCLKPTRLTLRLADGTTRYPKGVAEDVLVRVGEFLVPVDFVVCEMGMDEPFGSLILGRPFLATCRAMIDVGTGEITLRFEGEKAKTEKVGMMKEGKEAIGETVKVKTKTKPRWEKEKLVWKNTWAPKCFQPKVKDHG